MELLWLALAVTGCAGGAILWRFAVRQGRRELSELISDREVERQKVQLEHQQELREKERAVQQRLQATKTAHSLALREGAAESMRLAEEATAYRERSIKSMEWELGSRATIAEVCMSLGIDAVLATNVQFVARNTRGLPFVVQIDHVLLTESKILVIENKQWKGTVFDCRLPGAVSPVLENLIPAKSLESSFALQIKVDDDNDSLLHIMKRTGSKSPRSQVRRQAIRFSDHLKLIGGYPGWVHTCVFYSHPEATVYLGDEGKLDTGRPTKVVAGKDQLRKYLQEFVATHESSHRKPALWVPSELAKSGVDLIGFGSYGRQWASGILTPE